jgi:pyruvate carboxylase
VIGFLHGELGEPAGGFPEPFRTLALAGRRARIEPAELTDDDRAGLDSDDHREVRATLSRLLLPRPAAEFAEARSAYGDLAVLPTQLFLYGLEVGSVDASVELDRGVRLLVGLDAIGEPDEKGMRRVVFRLNGQLRPLDIIDTAVHIDVAGAEQADSANPGHVAAPFTGVVTVQVRPGDRVTANQPVAVIEAMKMESVISAPVSGVVERLGGPEVGSVEPGDLVLVIKPQ